MRATTICLFAAIVATACSEGDTGFLEPGQDVYLADVCYDISGDHGSSGCIQNDQKTCFTNNGEPGFMVCSGGTFGACRGLCKNGDDKFCRTTCGSTGTTTCLDGEWGGCTAPAETCNGLDDDCDGATDEDLARPCTTACGKGVETCEKGEWVGCTAPPVRPETCDGIDNDCNGLTDDGIGCTCTIGDVEPCGIDTGVCARGTRTCGPAGTWGTCGGTGFVGASPETCNGLDDDCDGTTDEDLFRTCWTACGNGTERCAAGNWVNCTAPPVQPELCDGIDNDCNGLTDDGLPPDQYENNDTCGMARPLGTLIENGDPMTVQATLLPAGDTDWFLVDMAELDDILPPCGPFEPLGPEICYVASFRLQDVPEGADYRMEVLDTTCKGHVRHANKDGQVAIGWTGIQMVDDGARFLVKVNAGGDGIPASCRQYSVRIEFQGFCFDEATGLCPWDV
jgi:hypothetical protein